MGLFGGWGWLVLVAGSSENNANIAQRELELGLNQEIKFCHIFPV